MTEAELAQRLTEVIKPSFAPALVAGIPLFLENNPTPFCVAPLASIPLPPGGISATLGQGSFWIAAQMLVAGAPANAFAGVRISSGVAQSSLPPQVIGGVLVFPLETQFHFELQLDVPGAPVAQSGPGQDAINAVVNPPASLVIDIQGAPTTTLVPFSLQAYGQTIHFTPSEAPASTSAEIGRLVLPAATDSSDFSPVTVQSTLFQPSGSAPITSAGWGMFVSEVPFDQLGQAPDAGLIILTTGPGLNLSSQQLNNTAPLGSVTFFAAPGTLEAIASPARAMAQTFTLWNAGESRSASVNFTTDVPAGLVGWLATPAHEQFFAGGQIQTHLDRPVSASGRPLPLAFGSAELSIDQLPDGATIKLNAKPPPPTPLAVGREQFPVVLENALLRVSRGAALTLNGSLAANGSVTSGSVALTHDLLSVVPTLPDPYVSNLNIDLGESTQPTITVTISWTDPASPVMAFSNSESPALPHEFEGSLLDVSGAVDQLGVSASFQNPADFSFASLNWRLPLDDIRLFTVPEISWEVMFDVSSGFTVKADDDGGSSSLLVSGVSLVPVTPAVVLQSDLDRMQKGGLCFADITLPFGIRAELVDPAAQPGAAIVNVRPVFPNGLQGANQISFRASTQNDPADFPGLAFVDLGEEPWHRGYGAKVLSFEVAQAFNSEFKPTSENPRGRVPLQRYDLCGYGASVFSDWRVPDTAPGSGIVQARFDVFIGRTAFEVVQFQANMYPWAVRVVRTVTIERKFAGWVLRHDSGWRAASDGRFLFEAPDDFEFQLGPLIGLTRIRNIEENGPELPATPLGVTWQPVKFDAELMLSPGIKLASGADGAGFLPSSGIPGYLMILPLATPLHPDTYQELLDLVGPVRAPTAGTIVPDGAKLKMRITDAEVSSAPAVFAGDAVVVGAVRGAPILPSQGSWSVAERDPNGTTAPVALDPHTPVPLIQNVADTTRWHMADPADVNRLDAPLKEYGLIQATGTQKLYFAQPRLLTGVPDIELPTAPHLADVGALLNATGAFPNLGAALQPPSPPTINTSDDGVAVTMEWDVKPNVDPAKLLGFGDVSVQLKYQYVEDRSKDPPPAPKRTHVTVEISPTGWNVTLEKVSFALVTPFGDIDDPILTLVGTIQASSTSAPTVTDLDVVYGALLGSVQSVFANLQQLAKFLPGGIGASLDVSFSDGKLTILDRFALPKLPLGIGFITDVALDLGATLTLSPPSLNLMAGISAPDRPFHWLVSPLSGTGCVQVGYNDANPAILIQAGLGVGLAIDLGIASGSASVVIALQVNIGKDIVLQAMLTGQASVDVLDGLASAAITLTAGLGLLPKPVPPNVGTRPIEQVTLKATCAVGIHISICWVVDIDFDGFWQFTQTVDVPDITKEIPI